MLWYIEKYICTLFLRRQNVRGGNTEKSVNLTDRTYHLCGWIEQHAAPVLYEDKDGDKGIGAYIGHPSLTGLGISLQLRGGYFLRGSVAAYVLQGDKNGDDGANK